MVSVPLLVMSSVMARADYSNAVMSLNPVGYWPLTETNQTSQNYTAHNSGTLGSTGNGYYNNVYTRSGNSYTDQSYFTGPVGGITSDGDQAAFFNGGTNSDANTGYMIIPDINHSLDQQQTFTAEVWVKPGGGDPNDITGTSYASTEWTSIMEKGGGGNGYNIGSDPNGNPYGWSIELAGIYTIGPPVGWYLPSAGATTPVFFTTNANWIVDFYGGNGGTPSCEFIVPMFDSTDTQWFHLVLTYDGTNASFYTNGVLAATTLPNLPQSTNYVIEAGSSGAPNTVQNYEFQSGFALDTNNAMVVGDINPYSSLSDLGYPSSSSGTIGFNCQIFNGAMDELAYYTNALSAATILKHYQDATAANTALYTNDVLGATPPVYLRFDDPSSDFVEQPFSSYPVATNYGSMGTAVNGQIQSDVTADVPGPSGIGFGSKTNAVRINGFDATVDVGGGHLGGTLLDPTNFQGHLPSFSLVYWFKSNPSDCAGRFQTILGRGDSGWRSSMDNSGFLRWNPGGGPELASPVNYNDGLWHQFVGVADGSSGTVSMYVDGQLSVSGTGMGPLGGTPLDLLIGGAPDYTTSFPQRDFAGQLAQVAFFTNALNAAQAEALYIDATDLAPVITGIVPSTNQSISATGSASFTAVASGQPVVYQWYEGATPLSNVPGNISGATNATLTINNAVPANQGNYTVVVTNSFGSVTSVVATLTVITNVEITTDLAYTNLTLYAGGSANFSIATAGAPPITYQWYSNNVAITGATSSSYKALAEPANATTLYYCVAKNTYLSVTSSVATIDILPDPSAPYPQAVLAANPVGFWRLSEASVNQGNDGVIAHDYWGGFNGVYTNVNLGLPGYNTHELTETAAQFGFNANLQDNDVFAIPTNVDFSAPSGSSSQFSIEAWVQGGGVQTTDAGLVSKGYGAGGEQFDMDCGSDTTNAQNPTAHSYRFGVRDASGNFYSINSGINPQDGLWHHLVGVVNEPADYMAFYIDGQLIGTNAIASTNGILASSRTMLIGSRPSIESTNNNDDNFVGLMDDVAVYNYALSGIQISNQFVSADIPAFVVTQPANSTASQNGSATFSIVAAGTPPLRYQWYDVNTGLPVASTLSDGGSTNATLLLTNVQSFDSYYCIVANAFGTNQSSSASLAVISGIPQIFVNVQPQYFVFLGDALQIPVTVYGTLPIGYQWQFSSNTNVPVWTSLSDNSSITGSSSNVLNIANAQFNEAGLYQLVITNVDGMVTSSVAEVSVGAFPVNFNGNGVGWSAESVGTYSVPQFTNGDLYLTDGSGSESRSSFFPDPLYIAAFKASFTYQTPSHGGADGMAFCIQNDPRGVSALGGGGGSLGVSGISPSVELELNLYTLNQEQLGYAFHTNGVTGAGGLNGNYGSLSPVSLTSGDPINITVYYANGQEDVTFTDTVANTSFSTSYTVDIPNVVGGDTAYVGFTGADGGATSIQTISNFTFVSLATEAIELNNNSAVISWTQITGYTLQSSTNLLSPNWVNVTNIPVIVNGNYQVTVPAGGKDKFYRLVSP